MSGETERRERLLLRAAGGGRIRSTAIDLWERGRKGAARATWAAGLREARYLHSAERKLVQEGLYGLVRSGPRIADLLGTEEPLALWLGWLVREGLPPEVAEGERPAPYAALQSGWDSAGSRLDPVAREALRRALPAPIIERLGALLGPEEAAIALDALDTRAPVHIRANTARTTRERLQQDLRKLGVESSPLPGLPGGLAVGGRHDLVGMALYREGRFEIQDAGSQHIVELVPPAARAIDVCAGAGGKSLALAARGTSVLALDVRPRALSELQRRAARAGVRVQTRLVPSDQLPSDLPRAEAVVVDAPCTGSGALRRHPEHRWQLGEADIAAKVSLQRRLISEASALVIDGGALIYATCSVLPDENERIVEDFLASHPRFTAERALRTWPHRDGCDGFYAALLRAR